MVFLQDGCQKIAEENVASRTTTRCFMQPWINRDVRRITRLKRLWFRRARRSKQPKDWAKYKALKKQAQNACRIAHDEYVSSMLTNDCNPKGIWKFTKSRKKRVVVLLLCRRTDLPSPTVWTKQTSWAIRFAPSSPKRTCQTSRPGIQQYTKRTNNQGQHKGVY